MATFFDISDETAVAVGTRVFCFDVNQHGSVVQTQTLGLVYAPTVLTDGGARVLYCGTRLPLVCPFFPPFLQAMEQLGYAPEEVERFKGLWQGATTGLSQRKALAEGLEQARAAGEVPQYIETVKTQLGL